jgi:hypothetical protein
MHLAIADISIVPLFADRITSAQGLGGALRFMGPYRKNQRVGDCPLSGVKRTRRLHCRMSANDPKRTSASSLKVVNFEQTRMRAIN